MTEISVPSNRRVSRFLSFLRPKVSRDFSQQEGKTYNKVSDDTHSDDFSYHTPLVSNRMGAARARRTAEEKQVMSSRLQVWLSKDAMRRMLNEPQCVWKLGRLLSYELGAEKDAILC